MSSIYTYDQGPQFRGKTSLLGLGLSIGALIYTFTVPVSEMWEWQNFIGLFLCAPIFLSGALLFLGVEGIEVDTENKQLRHYSAFLKWRFGEWLSFNEFQKITLDQYKSGHAGHSYYMFTLKLEGRNETILIEEFKSYRLAQEWMDFFGEKTGIYKHDHLQERIFHAKTRQRRK